MENQVINARIRAIINDRFDGNVSKFCRAIGIKQSTISMLLGPRQSSPSFEVIEKITNTEVLSDLSLRWLITGQGEMYIDKEVSYKNDSDDDNALVRALLDTIKEQQKRIDVLLTGIEAAEARAEAAENELKKVRRA